MKAALFSVILVFALAAGLSAQTTEKEWQKKAVSEYPDLGTKDSAFNKRFLELVARRREEKPAFFKDPKWPLTLADEIAKSQPALVETMPVLVTREFHRVPADLLKQLADPAAPAASGESTKAAQPSASNPTAVADGSNVIAGTTHVNFRPGRFATYNPFNGLLVIKDTPENVEVVRKLIARHRR